ncbi:MAG TPA: hypothetical protein VF292_11125 [Rhodanobacteraceae bacterium]
MSIAVGVPLASGGQIGLVLGYRGLRAPVEIKPFTAWKPETAPARKALWQVNRDQVYLSAAHGFLWLPKAGTGRIVHRYGLRAGLVWIVFGSVRSLLRAVEHRMR